MRDSSSGSQGTDSPWPRKEQPVQMFWGGYKVDLSPPDSGLTTSHLKQAFHTKTGLLNPSTYTPPLISEVTPSLE